MNFSKIKILFLCDSGHKKELGSGHLFRSITIAKFFKDKYNLKYKEIGFLTRINQKEYNSEKILKKFKFNTFGVLKAYSDYSNSEIKLIKKFSGKLIIIDRLGQINKKFIEQGLGKFHKKVIIEDYSNNRKFFDLSINSLITNVTTQKNSFIGLKYFISPIFYFNQKLYKKHKGIFIYLGNLKKSSKIKKIIKLITEISDETIYLPEIYRDKFHKSNYKGKILFFRSDKFYNYMNKSNILVISGGMSLFDALYLNKNIICIPQFKHQINNIINSKASRNIKILDFNCKNFANNFKKNIIRMNLDKTKKKTNSKINFKNMKIIINKIGNLLNV